MSDFDKWRKKAIEIGSQRFADGVNYRDQLDKFLASPDRHSVTRILRDVVYVDTDDVYYRDLRCEYCNRLRLKGQTTCSGCGAPL